MKLVRNGVVYIQVKDFQKLLEIKKSDVLNNKSFSSLLKEASNGTGIFVMGMSNANDFLEFRDPKSIDFLMNIDDIVDYDEIKDLSCEEMDALRVCIINERKKIASKVNMMSSEEQKEHPELFERYKTLSLRYLSVNDAYWFKRGKAKLVFPEGIEELKPISFGSELKLRLKNAFSRKNDK